MASEEYKESDLSKIVKRLMDEEGFEFGEAVREAMEQTKNFESKADGGSIGIEVLFTDKMANGGRVPAVSGGFLKLLAEGTAKGKKGIMELVESGKGRFDEFVETMNQNKKPSESFTSQNITTDLIDGPITVEKMANLDSKTLNIIKNTYDNGLYKEMPEILKAGNLLERFTKVVKGERIVDYERAESILGVPLKGDETLNEIFKIEFNTRPVEKLADGGRVGLFMGGDPLDGQALSIYNSMNAYGFSEQEIANALQEQGLYTPSSTPVVDDPITNTAPNIINQGGGGDDPPKGPTFNRNDLLGTPDYFPAEPFSFKDTISDIGDYIKGGGIIGAGIRGLKGLFSRNTKNYVTTPQIKARDRVEAERIAREEAARQEAIRQEAYAQARQDRETYRDLEASITSGQGGQGFDRPSSGPTATGAGMGVGGGYASDYGFLKNGGRVGYKDGGLVTMFKEKR